MVCPPALDVVCGAGSVSYTHLDVYKRQIQGREPMINKLLVGLNQGHFITIEWMDTEEIPLEKESSFTVR